MRVARWRELGEYLKRTREAQGKSIEEIVETTKIRSRYLIAIEEGDLDVMPGIVYARGFVRGYASYLGLDGLALTDQYFVEPAREPEVPQPAKAERVPAENKKKAAVTQGKVMAERKRRGVVGKPTRRQPTLTSGIVWVAIAVVFLTVAVVAYASLSAPPRSPRQVLSPTGGRSPANSATIKPGGTTAKAKPQAPAVTFIKTGSGAHSVNYQVASKQPLSVFVKAVSGPSWFSVVADGQDIVPSLTLQAGQTRTWTANSQIQLVVGASPNITMSVNGVAAPLNRNALGGYTYTFTRG